MNDLHVVVGAGPVGSTVATLLARKGNRVRIVTRSGTGPSHAGIERVSADASNNTPMRALAEDSAAIYNCANPAYTRWDTDWPPIASSLLAAAEQSGAVLATVSNLYGYGRVREPMSQQTPLAPVDHKGVVRAAMWTDALAAHEAGRARVVEVRASDYANAGASSHLARNVPALLAGKAVWVLGAVDQPHSWTTTGDTARLLIAAAADSSAHGRPWLVPSAPPRTQGEALGDIAERAGLPAPKVHHLGPRALRIVGLASPMIRELAGTAYQFAAPFVVDDVATREHFDMQPQPWNETIDDIITAARNDDAKRAS